MALNAPGKPGARGKASASLPSTAPNRKRGYRFIKRTFDILSSLIGLIALSPLFLLIAVAIYIDDPGPVLFLQERIGINGKVFRMWKFRSMVKDAEEKLTRMTEEERAEFAASFKLKTDARITRIGHLIRKTSLDELPQLLNILVGDMSLVGPRPPLLVEREAYGEHLAKVMSARPGLTGYWQVHGRNETNFAERIALQEYYIDHQSVLLDIRILFGTVKAVLTTKGAI